MGGRSDLAQDLDLSEQAVIALLVTSLLDNLQDSHCSAPDRTGGCTVLAAQGELAGMLPRLDGDLLASPLVSAPLDHREACGLDADGACV